MVDMNGEWLWFILLININKMQSYASEIYKYVKDVNLFRELWTTGLVGFFFPFCLFQFPRFCN